MVQREIAKKCYVKNILNGKYVVKEGWSPNYVKRGELKVSRANLVGVLISKGEDRGVLDDGSGQILLRNFEEKNPLKDIEVGDVILVVGRPRVYNDRKFIRLEIVKKQKRKWLQHRKKELEKNTELKNIEEKEKEEKKKSRVSQEEDRSEQVKKGKKKKEEKNKVLTKDLLKTIKDMDSGDGVDIDKVIEKHGDGAEKKLDFLMREGEIFEVKAGRIKVLE